MGDIELDKNYVSLYNTAIDKIFEGYNKSFSVADKLDHYGRGVFRQNPKHFQYSDSSMNGDMVKCKQTFLTFMQDNFSNLSVMYKGILTNATFYIIVKKVNEFIDSMEVKSIKDVTTKVTTISVTLHDIIKKLTFTSFDSDHCKSEKLFMAVLLAILRLHCPTPIDGNDYTLTFEFAPSFLGPSGLQKTSKTCSAGNVEIDASKDPVDANIFGFDDSALKQVTSEKQVSALDETPPALPVEEEEPATMIGDELFETYGKILPTRDQLEKNIDIEAYRQNVLSKFNIESRDEICKLLLISCNGTILEKFKKLLFFKEIFVSEYCLKQNQNQPEKCHELYKIVSNTTSALQTSLLKTNRGGSKSRRKPARKTRRGRGRTRKSKAKTHRRRRHSRIRKHKKKYTSSRRR